MNDLIQIGAKAWVSRSVYDHRRPIPLILQGEEVTIVRHAILDSKYGMKQGYLVRTANDMEIYALADDITVYPAHGAGSACGKNMQKETVDILGNQKKTNYALNQPNKEAFIKAVTDGLLPPPAYFGMNVAMNKQGYQNFDEVLNGSNK